LPRKTQIGAVVAAILLAGGADVASAAPSARVNANGTLLLTGTATRDDVTLRVRSEEPNRLEIDLADDGSADLVFGRREFDRIRVRARGGNDRVRIDDSQVQFTTEVPTLIEGEKGDDRLTGGAGGERFTGGRGSDIVDGGGGNDRATLGAGRDHFRWTSGDGSDTVAGGQGRDDLTFRGSTAADELSLTANGTRVRLRSGVDAVALRLGGMERIGVLARRGADALAVGDLAGSGVRRVGGDLGAGDGAQDRVTVEGTTGDDTIEVGGIATIAGLAAEVALAGVEPTDALTIDARGGADRVSSEDLPANALAFSADGGAGADTIVGGPAAEMLLGGGAADTIDAGGGDDTVDGNGDDDVARLGGGDDTLAWKPGGGSDTVEGEGGRDTMRFAGSDADEQFAVARVGNRVRYTRDVGGVVMDLHEVERIDTLALGGADMVTPGDVAGTDLDEFNTDFAADGTPDRLVVSGTGAGDAITASGSGGNASVTGLQSGLALAVKGAQGAQDALELNTRGGDDQVRAQLLAADTLALTADGGGDDDTLIGAAGADRLLGGPGIDTVDGNRGDDVALLGEQGDTFVWDPGDGSDIVDGDTGQDTLQFNGSADDERFALGRDGTRVRFTRDVGNVVMDLDGVERLDAAALGGADVLSVGDTTRPLEAVTALEEVRVDLAGTPGGTADDGQPDKVNVNATEGDDVVAVDGAAGSATVLGLAPLVRIAHANAADDELAVHLLDGGDIFEGSTLDADAIALQVQGGPHDDLLFGGDGPDTLLGGPDNDTLVGRGGLDTLDGGPGNNTLIQD
jgi:Ca2+-binding RTX toxin-like protein